MQVVEPGGLARSAIVVELGEGELLELFWCRVGWV
jgi:hypothetical protein